MLRGYALKTGEFPTARALISDLFENKANIVDLFISRKALFLPISILRDFNTTSRRRLARIKQTAEMEVRHQSRLRAKGKRAAFSVICQRAIRNSDF